MGVYLLIDCNNFFVSCEKVFDPSLKNKPVAVLSNNDGCIIARSNEVKALGIKMGMPLFKCRYLLERHKVRIFSSNFALYADMSARVMQTVGSFGIPMEVYSIDEAFLLVHNFNKDILDSLARSIRQRVQKWTGITISVGIGPTKTLAKVANKQAKKNPTFKGVYSIFPDTSIDSLLQQTEVADIWGIGRKYTKKLDRAGITNALALKNASDLWVRKNMTILGLKTVWELRGIACYTLEEQPEPNDTIACTRSFAQEVTSLQEMRQAIAYYVSRAAYKMRKQNQCAQNMYVFVMTSRFKDNFYYKSASCVLSQPTAFTPTLISSALAGLQKIFKHGYRYKKAGVILCDLLPQAHKQIGIFDPVLKECVLKQNRLMQVTDRINTKWGKDTIVPAAVGIKKPWHAKRDKKSARFTTCWYELPVVKK